MSKLPAEWNLASIEDAMEAIIDYRGKTPTKTTSGIPLITAKIIDNGRIAEPTEFISENTYLDWMKRGFPKQGDVLITTEAPLGEVAQLQHERVALAQRVILLRGQSDVVDNSYLKWVLQSPLVQDQLRARSTGSTVLGIKQSELRKVKFPYPPIAEQRRIAAILDRADAVRRKRQHAIALTEELLRSAFLEMFGDPAKNTKGWEMVAVGDVVSDVRDGPHVSPEYSEAGIPILSTRNIRPGRLILEDIKYVSEETYSKLIKQFRPQFGDVLLTKGGTTGFAKAVDWNWPFAIWVHLAALRPTEKIRPEFLESALNSPSCYAQSQRYTHGIANRDLGLTRIRKIQLSLPPLHLQDQFCKLRQAVLKKYAIQEQSVHESENLFNSLLQKAFRGEL